MAPDPRDYDEKVAAVLKVVDGMPLAQAKTVLMLASDNLQCTCSFQFDGQLREHLHV